MNVRKLLFYLGLFSLGGQLMMPETTVVGLSIAVLLMIPYAHQYYLGGDETDGSAAAERSGGSYD